MIYLQIHWLHLSLHQSLINTYKKCYHIFTQPFLRLTTSSSYNLSLKDIFSLPPIPPLTSGSTLYGKVVRVTSVLFQFQLFTFLSAQKVLINTPIAANSSKVNKIREPQSFC